jgi:hypothetical protein
MTRTGVPFCLPIAGMEAVGKKTLNETQLWLVKASALLDQYWSRRSRTSLSSLDNFFFLTTEVKQLFQFGRLFHRLFDDVKVGIPGTRVFRFDTFHPAFLFDIVDLGRSVNNFLSRFVISDTDAKFDADVVLRRCRLKVRLKSYVSYL